MIWQENFPTILENFVMWQPAFTRAFYLTFHYGDHGNEVAEWTGADIHVEQLEFVPIRPNNLWLNHAVTRENHVHLNFPSCNYNAPARKSSTNYLIYSIINLMLYSILSY